MGDDGFSKDDEVLDTIISAMECKRRSTSEVRPFPGSFPPEMLAHIASFVEEDVLTSVNLFFSQVTRPRRFRSISISHGETSENFLKYLAQVPHSIGRLEALHHFVRKIQVRRECKISGYIFFQAIGNLSCLQEIDWGGVLPSRPSETVATTTTLLLRHIRFQTIDSDTGDIDSVASLSRQSAHSIQVLQIPSKWLAKILDVTFPLLTTFTTTTPISTDLFESAIPVLSNCSRLYLEFDSPGIPDSVTRAICGLHSLRELKLTAGCNTDLEPHVLNGLGRLERLFLCSRAVPTYKVRCYTNSDSDWYFKYLYDYHVIPCSQRLTSLAYMYAYGASYRLTVDGWVCEGWITLEDCCRI